jgi:DNA-binding winged helix-turn-helix (wHTH) protein/class 3 adenylate cyclase/tetratricopeptide (TPR) repeat protein
MSKIFVFGDSRLDPARRELTRAGALEPVEPQVLDLLLDLIEHRERVVTRDELIERVWHGRIVAEATLSSRIKSARRAIGDNGRDQRLVRTIHGRGFRFVGAVRLATPGQDDAAPELAAGVLVPPSGSVPGQQEEQADPALASGARTLASGPACSSSTRRSVRPDTLAQRRQLTIVRCSLVDAALSLDARDPEEFDDFLSRAKGLLVANFEAFGGHVARTYSAGALVYFGWPRASEDAAQRAVQAALAVGTALRGLSDVGGPPVEARCGIATGTVVVGGLVANAPRLAGGRAPVLATRLMDLARPSTVLVTESTRALLGEAFLLKQCPSDRVAGLGDTDRVWQVLGAVGVATRFEAGMRSRLTPLIGRDEELALLRRRWERAAAGDGQVVLVSGDAGIGKSRLVHDFIRTLDPDDHWRIVCQCSPHHANSALSPVIREIERAAQLERDDDDAIRIEKIRRLLARAGQWSAETTELIAELLSIDHAPVASTVRSAQQRQEMTLDALAGMVRGLARQRAVLFLLEDAHWIDPTTADLIHRIDDLADQAPVLVLITLRPDFTPPWAGRAHVSQLSLSRLTAADTALMARRVAGEAQLSELVQTQIAERTDGVPLYVEELTRAIIAAHPENHSAAGSLALVGIPEEVPATLQDLLLAQLDRLGEAGEVARIGAAIGRSFGRELLLQITDLPEDALDAALRRLTAGGTLFAIRAPPRDRYVFKHALVHDAAYQGLTHDRRRQLHARIAAALEDGFLEGPVTEPEILAQHFEKADQLAKAFACCRRAGEIAAQRYTHAEAVAHLRRARELLEREPEDAARRRAAAELLARLGRSAIVALGDGHPETCEIYLRLERICASIDDERLRCDALFGLSQHAQVREPVDRSLAIASRYVESARRLGDRRQLAIAHWIRAQDYWRSGRFAEGVAEARRGRRAFDARQSTADLLEHPEILNRTVEAYCACMLGQVGEALGDLRAMAEEAREAANPLTPERILTVLGVTHQLLRDVGGTAMVAQQMTALSQIHRRPQHGDWLALLHAWVLTAQGDTASGIAQATNAMKGLEIKSRRPRRLSILAECFAAAGQITTAQDLIAKALVETEALGERFWEAELNRQRGELLLAAGDPVDAAEACFERALALARGQQARLFELKAAVSLARLWTRHGRRRDATAVIKTVLQGFDLRYDFADLRDARMLLDLAKTA